MANLSKVVKVTQAQYSTLVNGGTVSGQTYDANAIYLVDDTGKAGIYLHEVTIYLSNAEYYSGVVRFHIFNNSATSFTLSTFISYVNSNYPSGGTYILPTIGPCYWGNEQQPFGSQWVQIIESAMGTGSSSTVSLNCTDTSATGQGGAITFYTSASGTRPYMTAIFDKVIAL